jgi:hypothetical protein
MTLSPCWGKMLRIEHNFRASQCIVNLLYVVAVINDIILNKVEKGMIPLLLLDAGDKVDKLG